MRESSSVRLIWSCAAGPCSGAFGGLPPGFLPVCAVRAARLASFILVGSLILFEAHAGARLDLGLRGVHGGQAILPALDLVGQVDAVGKFRLVGALGQCQELLHFGLELALEDLDVAIGKRAVA